MEDDDDDEEKAAPLMAGEPMFLRSSCPGPETCPGPRATWRTPGSTVVETYCCRFFKAIVLYKLVGTGHLFKRCECVTCEYIGERCTNVVPYDMTMALLCICLDCEFPCFNKICIDMAAKPNVWGLYPYGQVRHWRGGHKFRHCYRKCIHHGLPGPDQSKLIQEVGGMWRSRLMEEINDVPMGTKRDAESTSIKYARLLVQENGRWALEMGIYGEIIVYHRVDGSIFGISQGEGDTSHVGELHDLEDYASQTDDGKEFWHSEQAKLNREEIYAAQQRDDEIMGE
jgi:hypothetical protein